MSESRMRWFAVSLDASLKSALLAVFVAAIARLLRIHDSNIRHRAWTGVLAGMLLLAVVTPLVPARPLPLLPSPEWLLALAADRPPDEQVQEPNASVHSATDAVTDFPPA